MTDVAWNGLPNWDKEPEVDEIFVTYIDDNVMAELPSGDYLYNIVFHGASFWTRTAKIVLSQGEEEVEVQSYFLKVAHGQHGKDMMHGEFESMKAIYVIQPDLAPKPLAWGTYQSDDNVHFFLSAFHMMDDDLCSLDTFPKLISELHMRGESPNGQFGFPVTTFQGRLAQDPTWCNTWQECFTRNISLMFKHEIVAQGYEKNFFQMQETLISKVIPRLLRPMESGPRTVTPRLVHGDLWEGNAGTDLDTGVPKIFDASCLYAHNEYELAPWRPLRQKMNKPYVIEYLNYFPISEPVEDFEGRNMLYALRFNLCSSALYPGNLNYRKLVRQEMAELIDRYGEGFEGWLARSGESDTALNGKLNTIPGFGRRQEGNMAVQG